MQAQQSKFPRGDELAQSGQNAQLVLVGIFQAVALHILIVTNYDRAIAPLADGEVNTVALLYLLLTLAIIGAITLLYLIQVIYYRWALTAEHHGIFWFGIGAAEYIAAHSANADSLGIWFVSVGAVGLLGMVVYLLDLREVPSLKDSTESDVQGRQRRQLRGHCLEMLVTMAMVSAVSFLFFGVYQFGTKENVHVATVSAGIGLAMVFWVLWRAQQHNERFNRITSDDDLRPEDRVVLPEDRVWAAADWVARLGANISRPVRRRIPATVTPTPTIVPTTPTPTPTPTIPEGKAKAKGGPGLMFEAATGNNGIFLELGVAGVVLATAIGTTGWVIINRRRR